MSMIGTSRRLIAFFVVLSVLVVAGMAYGLLGESLGLRSVYHAPGASTK
jgi:hypothetical protein